MRSINTAQRTVPPLRDGRLKPAGCTPSRSTRSRAGTAESDADAPCCGRRCPRRCASVVSPAIAHTSAETCTAETRSPHCSEWSRDRSEGELLLLLRSSGKDNSQNITVESGCYFKTAASRTVYSTCPRTRPSHIGRSGSFRFRFQVHLLKQWSS